MKKKITDLHLKNIVKRERSIKIIFMDAFGIHIKRDNSTIFLSDQNANKLFFGFRCVSVANKVYIDN